MNFMYKLMKKKNNKGFSLIELIIVIAIMAILVGVLTPQLLKYLDKSRKSGDVNNAQIIGSAVEVALTDEKAIDAIADGATSYTLKNIEDTTNDFTTAVKSHLKNLTAAPKYETKKNETFIVTVTKTAGTKEVTVEVSVGAKNGTGLTQLYPNVADTYTK